MSDSEEIQSMLEATELTSTSEANLIEDEQILEKINKAVDGNNKHNNRQVYFAADKGTFTANIVFAEKNGSIAIEFTVGNNEPKDIALEDSHIRQIILIKTPQGDWYVNSKNWYNKQWEQKKQLTKDEVAEHNMHTIELALQALATPEEE